MRVAASIHESVVLARVHDRPTWADVLSRGKMPAKKNRSVKLLPSSRRPLRGWPVARRNVAGIDLGSKGPGVCAPNLDGSGREIGDFGATRPELLRMAEWLKEGR